jgi:hypothetical protein
LEKAALEQFNKFCTENHLFPEYQSAYRTNYSCETALISVSDDILWAMEHKKVTALAAIDLSAAFDTVDHEILLNVLNVNFGICGVALDWISTYLIDRSFCVNVNESYSTTRNLAFSVPQGSCFGPTLYSVYASTMQEVVPHSLDIHGYADDHAVKISFIADSGEEANAVSELESCLSDIKIWMDNNRLKMNDTKTEFICYGSRQQLGKCKTQSIDVNSITVHKATSIKYLGVDLDQELSYKTHIKRMCKIAMYNLFRIRQIRQYLTVDACKTVILGLVITHLDNSNGLFYKLPDTDIKKLQRVQNAAAKLVLRKGKYDSATNCLKDLHWLPIKLRVQFKIILTVHKCLLGNAPAYLSDKLKVKGSVRTLRLTTDTTTLEVPFTRRKTFADRSFSVSGPELWNELPTDMRNIQSTPVFKKALKTYLFAKF